MRNDAAIDFDLKADANRWGVAWLDQYRCRCHDGHISELQPFEVFIRPRLLDLLAMDRFSKADLVQWIEIAHAVVALAVFGCQNIVRDRGIDSAKLIDPAKLLDDEERIVGWAS
ncbi:hypothetical protein [Bradyrhizobium sp. LA6.12]|uniref:hypothetical protein n=1 Tax=unclassified Bradyrhizobium TaxID=2631580 RepID=UPI003393BA65